MVANNEGLTKTYNRFHDPTRRIPRSCGCASCTPRWTAPSSTPTAGTTSRPDCEFLLDYEIDEDERGDARRPYRYRWPDEVRDEVLALASSSTASARRRSEHSGQRSPTPPGRRQGGHGGQRPRRGGVVLSVASRPDPGGFAGGARAAGRGARTRPRRAVGDTSSPTSYCRAGCARRTGISTGS